MSRVNPSNLADLVTFQSVLSSVLITMSRSISGILRDAGQSRPATDGANEGGICARPAEVQRPGHQLLAGTRFTLDQHRRQLTVAHAPLRFLQLQDEVLDRSHRRGLADHQLKSALAGFALLIEGQLTFHALRLPTLVE